MPGLGFNERLHPRDKAGRFAATAHRAGAALSRGPGRGWGKGQGGNSLGDLGAGFGIGYGYRKGGAIGADLARRALYRSGKLTTQRFAAAGFLGQMLAPSVLGAAGHVGGDSVGRLLGARRLKGNEGAKSVYAGFVAGALGKNGAGYIGRGLPKIARRVTRDTKWAASDAAKSVARAWRAKTGTIRVPKNVLNMDKRNGVWGYGRSGTQARLTGPVRRPLRVRIKQARANRADAKAWKNGGAAAYQAERHARWLRQTGRAMYR